MTFITKFCHCFSRPFAHWTDCFSFKSMTIKVLLIPQRKSFSRTCTTRFEVFRALSTCPLASRACRCLRIFSFDNRSVVDISNRDWNINFKGRRFSLIFWLFRVHLVEAGQLFDGLEDILSVSFILLPFLLIAEGLEGLICWEIPSLRSFIFFAF